MKLKERIRIAWQVLTKGTCDELERAALEKEEAIKAAYNFEYFMRQVDVHPAILAIGDVVGCITLADTELSLIHPNERPFYSSARPRKNYIYTLRNVEDKFAWEATLRNADELNYIKTQAAHELAHKLIREGLMKTEVLPYDYDAKRIRCWVPYYKLSGGV